MCAACGALATGRMWWREYAVCGDCFTDRTADELAAMVGHDDAGPCCLGSARGALDHEPGCMEAGR